MAKPVNLARTASPRGEALFRCARPIGVPRGPSNSSVSLTSQRLCSLCLLDYHKCFLPQTESFLGHGAVKYTYSSILDVEYCPPGLTWQHL